LERTWHSSAKGSAGPDTGSGVWEQSSRAVSLGSGVSDVSSGALDVGSVGSARSSCDAFFGSGALATGSGATEQGSEGAERSHDASAGGSLGAVRGSAGRSLGSGKANTDFREIDAGFVSGGRVQGYVAAPMNGCPPKDSACLARARAVTDRPYSRWQIPRCWPGSPDSGRLPETADVARGLTRGPSRKFPLWSHRFTPNAARAIAPDKLNRSVDISHPCACAARGVLIKTHPSP
jgi:hypothetical protein